MYTWSPWEATDRDLQSGILECSLQDSTLRDFAQGAYRLRGIGRGQKLKAGVSWVEGTGCTRFSSVGFFLEVRASRG